MRFNVVFQGYEHLDNIDPDWLQYRLRLAELTSFHSLRQQSLTDFKLVILINRATPEPFVDALKAATHGLNVILLPADSAVPQDISATLLDNVDAGCVLMQTSRIDSDDMFHPDYLRNIADFCTANDLFPDLARHPRYFRYPHGQDYLTQSATCNRIHYPENAFGTLIEPVGDSILTVLCEQHKRMSKRFASFALDDGSSMWCRILHGSNLINRPRKPLALTDHFAVHPDLAEFAKLPVIHPPKKHEP